MAISIDPRRASPGPVPEPPASAAAASERAVPHAPAAGAPLADAPLADAPLPDAPVADAPWRRPPTPGDGRGAIEAACLSLTRMAGELGMARATLEAYRLGTRRPPAAVRARLAEYLARRAEALQAHADALGAGPLPGPATPADRPRADAAGA
jgi:hypothetical protein